MSAPGVRVITTDAGEFPCAEGDTVLRAALRAGVAANYECNSGGCGTCKFVPRSGEFLRLHEDPAGLTVRDRRKGRELACQAVPVGDCALDLGVDPRSALPVRPALGAGVVVARRELTHDLTELTVEVPGPAEFLPGQYAMLCVADPSSAQPFDRLRHERAYSMSNLPNPAGQWEFQIKEVPGGAESGRFARQAEVGTRVTLDGPYGHAYLRDSGRDLLCIAGGSGLAPMVSVARGLAARADAPERSLRFFYGGRAVRDRCAAEFIAEIADRLAEATLVEVLSEAEPTTWDGAIGFVHEAVHAAALPDLTERDVYVAGPPVMTDAVVRLLMHELGVPADHIYYDRFF